MALGFFKKPRASNRNKVMQMLPAHQVDHNPSEWARTYMEAVAAKATLNVADKVMVTASKEILTSGRNKPLPPLPWEMVSEDQFERKDSSGECENEVNEDWMTGGPLLRAFQTSELGTPTASATGSTASLLQEADDGVLEREWIKALTSDLLGNELRATPAVSQMSAVGSGTGLADSVGDLHRGSTDSSGSSSLPSSEVSLAGEVEFRNDAADDGKAPQDDFVEIACCSEEDMQRCLSYSYRKKHGSSTPFAFCVLAGGATDE
ncbi:uncharacterized protein LAESUDRAFT_761200 [Laetiporus sulphureus 93-53]|uniref:Uncharacterized protein n=1 Tax=Laetiporus sulphureus 93-53 TaxID=1314785 RepID=A0A165D8X2_9APHY|nr:uncharacterized protein LAESUDRAFT_761200 [Laetiporus sulphureus 93-53]KZT04357.1 hypothetical protein LAESUDRAFT_761200 [Laetiporus sulphureus 93-53]